MLEDWLVTHKMQILISYLIKVDIYRGILLKACLEGGFLTTISWYRIDTPVVENWEDELELD